MANRSDGESVLQKHLRILDAFDPLRPYLRLTDITVATGLAHATAYRLASELVQAGLLERGEDRSYRLGVRLWEISSRVPGPVGLRELALPWMSAVHARVRQHTQLAVLNGRDVLFVERMSTRDAVVNATLTGGRLPLPLSSSGMVLLAHADEQLVDRVVSDGWPRLTAATIANAADLKRHLQQVRADGFALLSGHIHPDARGIAVPVFGAHRVVLAALGVVVPNDDSRVQGVIELLRVASAGVSRALVEAHIPAGSLGGVGIEALPPLVSASRATIAYFADQGVDATAVASASSR